MARPRKPARLWLDDGRTPPEWYVLDNVGGERIKRPTGCGAGDRAGAEQALAGYIDERDRKAAEAADEGARRLKRRRRRADEVAIAEIVDWALKNNGPRTKRPSEYAQRALLVLDYAGEDMVDAVDRDWCQGFADHVGSASYARRALEDLRAAVNDFIEEGWLRDLVRFTLPTKSLPRPDYLNLPEIRALIRTAWWERDVQSKLHGPRTGERWFQDVVSTRRRWAHLVPYIVMAVLTCSRAARIYEASYASEQGRPWVDLDGRLYHRLAPGETESANKRAPTVPLGDRLIRSLRRWSSPRSRRGAVIPGDAYLVQYAGRPVDCRRAFVECVAKARERFPDLFKRPDGTPKLIVRHTLRHSGVTLLTQWGVPPDDVCGYAGMEREVYDRIYRHHDPDHMASVMATQGGRKKTAGLRKSFVDDNK